MTPTRRQKGVAKKSMYDLKQYKVELWRKKNTIRVAPLTNRFAPFETFIIINQKVQYIYYRAPDPFNPMTFNKELKGFITEKSKNIKANGKEPPHFYDGGLIKKINTNNEGMAIET